MKRLILLLSVLLLVCGLPGLRADEPQVYRIPTCESCGKAEARILPDGVRLSRWNGEAALALHYRGPGRLRSYAAKDGLEVEVVLDRKPSNNVFAFDLDGAEDFNFFPQPALAPEDVRHHRPENVVDSIAVYHKRLRDHEVHGINYEVGKFTHIYRTQAIDAKGRTAWGWLNVIAGHLYVTVPDGFLADAAYPVVVDPTFGYATVGGSNANGEIGGNSADEIFGTTGTPASNGTVVSSEWYGGDASGAVGNPFSMQMGIYTYNGTNATAQTDISNVSVTMHTFGAAGWNISTNYAGNSLSSSQAYMILAMAQAAGDEYVWYDSGTNVFKFKLSGVTYGTWAASYSSFSTAFGPSLVSGAVDISMYVTYNATGGGGSSPNCCLSGFNK